MTQKFVHTIQIERCATFEFPDAIFTPEHLAVVQAYSEAGGEIKTAQDLRIAIASYWALYGEGYAEPYGCNILTHAADAQYHGPDGSPLVLVSNEDSEIVDGEEREL
jgi:hypothetical protein